MNNQVCLLRKSFQQTFACRIFLADFRYDIDAIQFFFGKLTFYIKATDRFYLIPEKVTDEQASVIYADEADMLNVAMFGMTARTWRERHPNLKGNIRDYASINELICLSNMESLNSVFISQGMPQHERLLKLNQIAIQQMRVLEDDKNRQLLK